MKPKAIIIIILLIIVCIPSLLIHLRCEIIPDDDAFIIYRHVDNALSGKGMTYNHGTRILGASTPLYLTWLTFIKSIFRNIAIPELAVRTNIIFFLLFAFGIILLLRSLTKSWVWGACCIPFLFLNPLLFRLSINGMESFVFSSLVIFAILAGFKQKFILSYCLAGIATLARPEGIFCALALLILLDWKNLRQLRFCFIAYSVPLLLWGIFAYTYYDTIIPHSIIAKAAPLYPLPSGHAFALLLQFIDKWTTGGWIAHPGISIGITFIVIQLAVIGLYLYQGKQEKRETTCLLLLFLLFFGFYVITNPFVFEWYFPHLITSWLLIIAAGLSGWQIRFLKNASAPKWKKKVLPIILTIWMLILTITSWYKTDIDKNNLASMGRNINSGDLRVKTYKEVAEWLNSNTDTLNTVVASPEIGALGYYYEGPILDACGLVSPEALPFIPVPADKRVSPEVGSISADLIKEQQPDFVVTMDTFAVKSIFESHWFSENYELAQKFPLALPLWGSKHITLFKLKK